MNRFDRYVMRYFVQYMLIVLFVVMTAAMLASGITEVRTFGGEAYAVKDMFLLLLISFPIKLSSTMPITVVVASIVTIVLMMRNKEMLAYVSLGGRISKLLKPFILVAILVASFMLYFDHNIYPQLKAMQSRQRYVLEGQQPPAANNRLVNMWIVDNTQRLVHVELIDPINKLLVNVTEYILDEAFQVEIINKISQANFKDNAWELSNFRTTNLTTLPPSSEVTELMSIESALFDDLTSMSGKRRKELMPTELAQMIRVMKNHGLNAVEYEMLLYSIYAAALSVIVLVIIVVPIGIDFSRRYSPIKSSILSFALGLSFWGVLAAMGSLGSSGIMPPLVANFSPLVIFLAIGAAILVWRERVR